jgi:mRNA-binding protein PUF3
MFSRFSQPSRQNSSFSIPNGRAFNERSGSIHSESFHALGRLNNDQEPDARMAPNRSFSINAFTPAHTPGQDLNDAPTGSYTPDGYPSAQLNGQHSQLRSFQLDNSRSTPNGTGARQSPFSSYMSTPPVYDRLNPYSSEQMLAHPNSVTQLQNKLAGFQMAQAQQRNYISPNQLHQQQYSNVFPTAQLQNPYQYQYGVPNGVSLSAIPQHMNNMASISPMMPLQACSSPPRGPREQQMGDGLGAMSQMLANFKRDQKQSKRWELTEIKGYLVEFAGDQHGSRFIQQKLESANSEVKDSVFRELEENALQLMQDVFGNYVIQKFFEHGDQIQKKILVGKMKGHVLELANQMYACRVVQKVLSLFPIWTSTLTRPGT